MTNENSEKTYQKLKEKAKEAIDASNTELALEIYQEAEKLFPEEAEIPKEIGNLYLDKVDYELAKFYYLKSLELNPNYVNALQGLGNIYKDTGDLELAAQTFQKELEINPDYAPAYYGLAQVRYLEKRDDEIEDLFKKALQLEPNNARTCHALALYYIRITNNLSEAKRLLQIGLLNEERNSKVLNGEIYDTLALIARKEERRNDEETLLLKALEYNSEIRRANHYLGYVYYNQEKYEKALDYWKKYFQLCKSFKETPDSKTIQYMSKCVRCLRRVSEEIPFYHDLLDVNPRFSEALYALGFYYGENGECEKGIFYLQQISDSEPTLFGDNYIAHAYFALGCCYQSLVEVEKAVENYEKAIDLEPSYTYGGFDNMADLYEDCGNIEKAEFYRKQVTEMEKDRQ